MVKKQHHITPRVSQHVAPETADQLARIVNPKEVTHQRGSDQGVSVSWYLV